MLCTQLEAAKSGVSEKDLGSSVKYFVSPLPPYSVSECGHSDCGLFRSVAHRCGFSIKPVTMHGGDPSGSAAPAHADIGHCHFQNHEQPVQHSIGHSAIDGYADGILSDHGKHHDDDHRHHHHRHSSDEDEPPPYYTDPYPTTTARLYGTLNTEASDSRIRRRTGPGGLNSTVAFMLGVTLLCALGGLAFMISDLQRCQGSLDIVEKMRRGCCTRMSETELYCP